MRRTILRVLGIAVAIGPAVAFAQSPKTATYITDEEVKKVNSQPGIDHTIRVVDIGTEHLERHAASGPNLRVRRGEMT